MINNKTRVFFIEETDRVDPTPAKVFGEIVYVFKRHERTCSIWAPEFPEIALDRLERMEYNPLIDKVAVSGFLVPLTMIIGSLSSWYGQISVLYWNSVSREYVERKLGYEDECTRNVCESESCTRGDL